MLAPTTMYATNTSDVNNTVNNIVIGINVCCIYLKRLYREYTIVLYQLCINISCHTMTSYLRHTCDLWFCVVTEVKPSQHLITYTYILQIGVAPTVVCTQHSIIFAMSKNNLHAWTSHSIPQKYYKSQYITQDNYICTYVAIDHTAQPTCWDYTENYLGSRAAAYQ